MQNPELDQLRYPIGKFTPPRKLAPEDVSAWISEIETLPARLRSVITPLSAAQLDTPYRPHGWTVRQVVHHLCDSHLNSYIRFKLALTEDRPTIKPYDEQRWAELPDYTLLSVESSLQFLEALHQRWCVLLRALSAADLEREFHHPESGLVKLKENIGLYAWHGNHHLAHITALGRRMGWDF